MSEVVQPNPAVRKGIRALLLVSVLFSMWSMYVKSTNPNPPAWIDLPFGMLLIFLGLNFWIIPEPMLSTTARRVLALAGFALGTRYFIRFFV